LSQQPSSRASGRTRTVAGAHDHLVAFYDGDAHLVEMVLTFAEAGLRDGEAVIVVATAEHLDAIVAGLTAAGLDTIAAGTAQQLVLLDAAATLARFMVDGRPDAAGFRDVVGALVDDTVSRWGQVRVYGEMVALLWEDGEVEDAIALEDHWNDFGAEQEFVLLCAYPMRVFGREVKTEPFRTMCQQHAAILPHEHFHTDDRERLGTMLLERPARPQLEDEACMEQVRSDFVATVIGDVRGRLLRRGDELLVEARRTLTELDALARTD
jgi:hypothetical protein